MLGAGLGATAWADLTPKVYTGPDGGTWAEPGNWTPGGVPTNTHAVYLTNLTVKVDAEAVAGRLELVGGALIVGGAGTDVLVQAPLDAGRTNPVGLRVEGDCLLAGDCSIGGVNQACDSYLSVGGDLALAGGKALAIYAGARTNDAFTLGGGRVTVAGTTTLGAGSWIYPDCDPYTGAPVIFDLQNLHIAAGAGFDASQRGWGYRSFGPATPPAGTIYEIVTNNYFWTLAPGAGTSFNRGGGYGGKGRSASATRGLAYGHPYAPIHPGSPNGMYYAAGKTHERRGGGAVRIAAADVVLHGSLHADAGMQSEYGGSSGGGIWVVCSRIDFGPAARLSAVGGDLVSGYTSAGGGGRVSVAIGLSAAEVGALAAGATPEGLRYAPLTQVTADVRGGQDTAAYGESGTATLVQAPAADRLLQVKGSPLQAGTPTPGYATHRLAWNQTIVATAPSLGVDPASDGSVRYTCAGYTLADTNGVFTAGTTNEVSITATNNPTLTWLWGNREFRFRTAAGANGRLRMGEATNTLFEQWMPEGATIDFTVEAIPDAGYRFLCWEGDVVPGATFDRVLTVPTRLQARALTARFVPAAPVLTSKVFTGANNGFWDVAGNWTPAGVPTTDDAVYLTNKTVYVDRVAEAGRLVLSGGALIVAGTKATVTAQTPRDPARTSPVGLFVLDDLWLGGNVSVGGVGQACASYLTVGGDLTLTGSKALAVYAGPSGDRMQPFQTGGARVTVAGSTTIDSGCWFHPDCDTFTGHPVVFDLQDLVVAAGGGFDATQRGWGYTNVGLRLPPYPAYHERIIPNYVGTPAPGWGMEYRIGAGHGGNGGSASVFRGRGLAYGFPYAPFYPGSPNGIFNNVMNNYRRGGGAVRVLARDVILDGHVKADAGPQSNYGGSSGGGIWLTCQTITYGMEAGVSAQGGLCSGSYSSPGGGGRISIGVNLAPADLDALAAGETPPSLLYEELTQLAVDVTGGRGKLTGGVYAYGESGSATLVVSAEADKILTVAGAPLRAGGPSPAYGSHSVAHGTWVTNTVETIGISEDSQRVRYHCQGYALSNAVEGVASGTTNWVAFPMTENLTLTWLWGEPEQLIEVSAGANGLVRSGGVDGPLTAWYTTGAVIASMEAVPEPGYEFLYWLGDTPLGLATQNPLVFSVDRPRRVLALFRLAEPPATRVWNGGTAAPGAWHEPANWLPAGNLPGRHDHVVIDAGYCWTTNYAECGSLAISNAAILRVAARTTVPNRASRTESASQLPLTGVHFEEARLVVHGDLELTQSAQLGAGGTDQTYATALAVGGDLRLRDTSALAIYAGPTNQLFNWFTGSASVRVGGVLQVESNCWIYPASDRYTGGSPRFDVYRLSVAAGGGFDATERGFDGLKELDPETLAPGRGFDFDRGAGYGGRGGCNVVQNTFGQPYGFAAAPVYPGSCNGNYREGNNYRRGGGLVRVHAAGPVRLAGSLIADGSPTSTFGGPSGGGIWVTAERFSFLP
ncbi:MAG: hypothetical protein GX590_08750, partial [Lentisphaerae bacterium]|nr:hypothetical protein [Lentisphaerota bacterium]